MKDMYFIGKQNNTSCDASKWSTVIYSMQRKVQQNVHDLNYVALERQRLDGNHETISLANIMIVLQTMNPSGTNHSFQIPLLEPRYTLE